MDARIRVVPAADGGNPRMEHDITRRENDFYIFPFSEDGDQNYHFHLMVQVENDADEILPVRFTVNWGDEEYQSDRDYFLLCTGDHSWTRIPARVEGPESAGTASVPPGVSHLTFHPRYALERFERLVERLPAGVFHVEKIGETRMRRDILALEAGNRSKKPIAFDSRVHPYESISSYMLEGMIEWLGGGGEEAGKLLAEHFVLFIPMPNPDGVADGMNKLTHGGLNFEGNFRQSLEPEALAMKKYLLERAPSVLYDIHGWCNPRDNIWTNDSRIGKEVYRAILADEELFCKPVEILYRTYPWGTANHSCAYFSEKLGCSFLCSSFDHRGRTSKEIYAMGVALLKATAAAARNTYI